MPENHQELADAIIKGVGGKDNVRSVTHCITRLRFRLKDESVADTETIKNLPGVIQVIQAGGQYQVVLGDIVDKVYGFVCDALGLVKEGAVEPDDDEPKGKSNLVSMLMDTISGTMMPVLMVLAGAGMVKGLVSLFVGLKMLDPTSGLYLILYALGDGFFYFMPIILGFAAAKKFKCNEYVGATIGAALCYPTLVNLASATVVQGQIVTPTVLGALFGSPYYATFLGIPVMLPPTGYPSSVIPIIIAVWLASKIEHSIKDRLPKVLTRMLTPVITLVVTVVVTYLLIGPVTMALSTAIASLINLIYAIPVIGAPIGAAFVSGIFGVLVMFGLHWAVISIGIQNIAVQGYDFLLAAGGIGPFIGMAQGLAFCLVARKNQKVRDLAVPATVSQICGVGEPLMYGLLVPLKIPFIINIACSALGGTIIGAFGVKAYIMGGMGLFSLPNFINPATGDLSGMINYMIGVGIAMVAAFIAQWIIYDDKAATAAIK